MKGSWVPVSQALPEENGTYIIQFGDGTMYTWEFRDGVFGNEIYYGDNEVQNFKSCAKSLDERTSMPPLNKGLFSPMGYATIDDSKSIFIDPGSNILVNNLENHVDLYLQNIMNQKV